MIVATPSYIITYQAINPKGQKEDGVMLSPVQDLAPVLLRAGYKSVEIIEVRTR
jgi:hypothetical protein